MGGLPRPVYKMEDHPPTADSRDENNTLTANVVLGLIITICLTLAFGEYSGILHLFRNRSMSTRSNQLESDFKWFESALEMYKLNGHDYPTTGQGLEALVKKPLSGPAPIHWVQVMDKLILDPWGASYRYRYPGTRDPTKPELICNGPDGVADTPDDLSSQDE